MSEEKKNKSSEEANNESDKKDGFQMSLDFLKKNLGYVLGGVVIVALVIVLVFIVTKEDKEDGKSEIKSKKVSERVSEKIKDKLEPAFKEKLAPEEDIVLGEVFDESGLYKVNMTVNAEETFIYVTKDFSKIIPENYYINLKETLESMEDGGKAEKMEIEKVDLSVENKKALGIEDSSKPRLDYFVMSFCPYGNPADENASKIQAVFGDSVEVVPHYIVGLDEKAPNGYNSLHGPQEAHQDIRELCVLKNYGKDKFFEFTLASNDKLTYKNADSKWNDVARSIGVDVNVVAECEKNGLEIAKQEIGISKNAKVQNMKSGEITSIVSSPTVMINGEKVASSALAIQEALCESFTEGEKPAACEQDIESAEAASGSCN
ncbi:MAG: hypothetical protein KAT32_01545 [Candidatus Moranbacteria bacterium]|nr:hypothetical protein [Candidatus Moranbacteria bacterium]